MEQQMNHWARHALREAMLEAGIDVSIVALRNWSREEAGEAYRWARDRPDWPPPLHVWRASANREGRSR